MLYLSFAEVTVRDGFDPRYRTQVFSLLELEDVCGVVVLKIAVRSRVKHAFRNMKYYVRIPSTSFLLVKANCVFVCCTEVVDARHFKTCVSIELLPCSFQPYAC